MGETALQHVGLRTAVKRKTMSIKKNVKKPKEEVINVRLTKEQKTLLEDVAARQGMGLSTWLLHLGLADAQTRQMPGQR
jgi:hypothetical protein